MLDTHFVRAPDPGDAFSMYSNQIKSWDELIMAESNFGEEWAFRGQNNLKFPETSLERHCSSLGLAGEKIVDLEVKLIREFARRYHLYDGFGRPPAGHTLQWLALLQHYGAPTRLVDFTYSFFIAVYFAIEAADGDSAVWAIHAPRFKEKTQDLIRTKRNDGDERIAEYQKVRDGGPFRALFMNPNSRLRFAYPSNPILLNERLTIQQGVFLVPGDVTTTFEENVREVPNHGQNLVQIIIDQSCRRKLLHKLHRFGINAATLFPGLEGFAHSLRTKSLILAKLPPQGIDMLEQV